MKKRRTKKISEAKKQEAIYRFIRNAIREHCDKEGIHRNRRACFDYVVGVVSDYIYNDNFKSISIHAGLVDDVEFEGALKKEIRLFYGK
jgi:hypothetical protein